MKFGNLRSLAHNLADSLASGIGLLIGVYDMNVFGEAAAEEPGYIEVDFLAATAAGSPASPSLLQAIERYRQALPTLAAKHGVVLGQIRVLSARFGTDSVYGCHFTVTVITEDGRSATDRYVGSPGKRLYRR
ncbi:hypothetical protein ACG04R_06320 [Roseateles sp. BYS78W]|uniref:DUF3168 domain-containing protein n=1 Tax=Pelomonas candidula TaxID=3299025 RepID=A0ABW7H916_9BURK